MSITETLEHRQLSASQPQPDVPAESRAWKPYERVLFRVAFIFFALMSLPMSASWYKNLFTLNWLHPHYRDFYDIARFQPSILKGGPEGNTLWYGYADWFAVLAIAIAGGLVWTLFAGKKQEYNRLYYWLRVIVRYRAGIGIIGFGFTKLLPVQMPFPSEGILNTDFGDLTAQKIYWLSVAIVPWYQVFAGIVEVSAGVLLLFRKTTTIGAIMLFGALGDIVYVNFAYDGGVHVYSTYFVLFAAFLLIEDVPRFYDLLIREKITVPRHFYPAFTARGWKIARFTLKALVLFIFLGMLGFVQTTNFLFDPYKQPATKGLSKLRGYYNVTEFKLNGKSIPYSPYDSLRWQDVTFEKWTSLSYRVNKPVQLDLSNGGGSPMRDINRTFELTGVGGGRRVFYYEADTVDHVLYLQDKNVAGVRRNRNVADADQPAADKKPDRWIPEKALARMIPENERIDPLGRSARRVRGIKTEAARDPKRKHMILQYTGDGRHLILSGTDENHDSVYVVLDKVDKKYTLTKSTLDAGKYGTP